MLENWDKLGTDEQKRFEEKVRDSSLAFLIWTKENFEKVIDDICRKYNLEKTLSLPSVKDYPTVQAIKNADEGLKDLWSELVPLRTAQLVLPEILDPALQRLKLSFDDKPAKPAKPAKVTTATTGKSQPSGEPDKLDLNSIMSKPAAKRTEEEQDYRSALLSVMQHRYYPADPEVNAQDFLALVRVLELQSKGQVSYVDEERLGEIFSHYKYPGGYKTDSLEEALEELRDEEITGPIYLPSSKLSVQKIESASSDQKLLWTVAARLRIGQLVNGKELSPELQNINVFAPEKGPELRLKVSATGANKVQSDWGYVPSDPTLQKMQDYMIEEERWPINNDRTIPDLNPIVDLIYRAAHNELSDADFEQLKRLFAADPNNSVKNILSRIEKWQQDYNIQHMPTFAFGSTSAVAANREHDQGLRDNFLGQLVETLEAVHVYLLQQTIPADKLPEALRYDVMK